MALQDMLGGLPPGLLSAEQQALAERQARNALITNLGFGLLQASRGQPGQGKPSLGQMVGQVGPGAVQAFQGSFDRTLRDIMVGQQLAEAQNKRKREAAQQTAIESYISGLPEAERARFQAFPAQAAEAMFREQPEQFVQLTPAQAAERGLPTDKVFQASTKTGKISQVGGGGQTIQNIIGGGELTPGQKKVDEKFAEDFVAWSSGGGQDMAAQIAQLKPVISALEEGKPITGLQVAVQPDLLLAMTNPTALQSREQVEEVVQRNLRVILGAQFTEKEGERLIARAFNPKLPPQENAKRLRRLFLQMSTASEQKQEMANYFQENGTLRGFRGKMPSVQDFYNAMEGSAPTFSGDSAQSLQNQARRILEQRQGGR
jgi:hypothetical protein